MKNFRIFKIVALFLLFGLVNGCDKEKSTNRPVKIGILSGIGIFLSTVEGFKKEMTRKGYVEGENVSYVIRHAKGDVKRMATLANEFADSDIDLLLTTTNGGALAAKKALVNKKIPLVFTIVLSPVTSGIVDSLSNPSNNITGVRNPLDEFIGKRIEYLVAIAPKTKNIWAPRVLDYPTIPLTNLGLRPAANMMDVKLIETSVVKPLDVIEYLKKTPPPSIDAILILPDPVVQNPESLDSMFAYAKKHNIPVVASSPAQLKRGAIFSYTIDNELAGILAASLVDKILKNRDKTPMSVLNSEPILYLNAAAINGMGLILSEELKALAKEIW